MAIASLDAALAGMQPPHQFWKTGVTTVVGRHMSTAYWQGMPGPAVAPTTGLAGAALTSYLGQIPYINPGASSNAYLARFSGETSSQAATLILYDRLWHNSGFTVTSTAAQTVNSVAWPARDMNGTTNGDGVQIGVEVSTLMGAGTPTFTMSYTNSAGTAGRTYVSPAMPTTMTVGTFMPLGLQAGDVGVRSIQSITQSATMTSGVYHLVAYRVIARVGIPAGGMSWAVDALTSGFPRLYDNTVPFLMIMPQSTTAPILCGQMFTTHG